MSLTKSWRFAFVLPLSSCGGVGQIRESGEQARWRWLSSVVWLIPSFCVRLCLTLLQVQRLLLLPWAQLLVPRFVASRRRYLTRLLGAFPKAASGVERSLRPASASEGKEPSTLWVLSRSPFSWHAPLRSIRGTIPLSVPC